MSEIREAWVNTHEGVRYWDLRRRFEECRGTKIRQRMEALNRSYYVFCTNHDDLHQLFLEFQQPAVWSSLWEVDRPRSKLNDFLGEVARRLHNFVAGANTLADHTRETVRDLYSEQDFCVEYEQRVSTTFANDPLAKFLHDLRNYVVHRQVPLVQATLSPPHERGGLDCRIRLELEALRAWSGWTAKSREFLLAMEEPPCLATLVGSYRAKVEEFYSWLDTNQQASFPAEFAEMRSLHEQIVAIERSA